jgi:hypothetical protein
MALKMADIPLFDETFTHEADDGTQTTYAAAALFRFCEANPDKVEKLLVPVDQEHADFMYSNRGVEEDRLRALVEKPEALKKPILFIQMPDLSVLLVDGTHRYVLYYHVGCPSIPAYMVPWEIGKNFIIEDIPQTDHETLMRHSGITTLRKLGLLS